MLLYPYQFLDLPQYAEYEWILNQRLPWISDPNVFVQRDWGLSDWILHDICIFDLFRISCAFVNLQCDFSISTLPKMYTSAFIWRNSFEWMSSFFDLKIFEISSFLMQFSQFWSFVLTFACHLAWHHGIRHT